MIQPTAGYRPTADGQNVEPIPKPGKQTVPTINKIASESVHALAGIDPATGQIALFKDTKGNSIPYTPGTKLPAIRIDWKLSAQLGHVAYVDPQGKVYGVSNPATGGTVPYDPSLLPGAKQPTAPRYSKPFPGANGNWWNTDPATGIPFDTGQPAPAAAVKSQGTWTIKQVEDGSYWRVNPTTGESYPLGIQGRTPTTGSAAAGTKAGPGTSTWRLTSNRVDSQLQQWAKPPTPAWTYDYVKGWVRRPGTGATVKDSAGNVVPAGPEPKMYDDALQWALDQYQGPNTRAWQAHARKLVNDAYPMNGENGRPLEGGLAISAANDYAKAMLKRGVSAADALNAGLAQPYWRLDPSVLRKAITRVFPTPPKPLPPLGTIPMIPAGGLQVGGPPSAYAIP
jgi:hypothetical protein